jgi:eukaryotic-like serine/threonine-protein kinase
MGETWLGVQRGEGGFEQRVCLKFIHECFRDSEQAAELFLREAAIAASLRHSNIVGVIDADVRAGYMALELVDGTDLRTILRNAPEHRLPAPLAVCIAIELSKGLHYAHTRTRGEEFAGIVHRDLSPANVLISHAGEVKLADFGVAKVIRATGDVMSAVRGKLSYMAPEQMAGRAADARSDLFSLGVLLYETLSGQRPFDGENDADTVRRIMRGERIPLGSAAAQVPAGIAAAVESLIAVAPEDRPGSAADVIDAFSDFAPPPTTHFELARLALQSRPHHTLLAEPPLELPTEPAPAARPRKRRASWGFVLGLGLVAAVGSLTSMLLADNPAKQPMPTLTNATRSPPEPALAPATDAPSIVLVATEPELGPRPEPPTEASHTAPRPARGRVRVGVFPAGQVWIDGRPRGAAPLSVVLAPGPHTVAAGIETPAQTRNLLLAPGADEQLFFDLQAAPDRAIAR